MILRGAKCAELTDVEIIRRALVEVDYFSCLYERYGPRLRLYIQRISQASDEEAEDLLQDAFIKIWKNLNAYQPDLKLSSWLYRIVHNHVISVWRQKRTHGSTYTLEWDDRIINVLAEDLEEDAGTNDRLLRLQEALLALPDKYREVITLKYFEQMNYEDISDVLKIPEGTVATRLNRARQMMAKFCNQSKTKITAYGPR
ncbi:MAG: RNA polymerase sigma factor [Saprospiraceae bacterium]